MRETTLNEILGDFDPSQTEARMGHRRANVTLWLSPEDKARYDRLQQQSGRKFSKKAREVLLKLIELAEARAG